MTDTLTLSAFLLQRIADDEAAARAAAHGRSGRWASWNRSWDTERNRDLVDEGEGERMACLPMDLDEHIARHDPARVLAQCEALRAVVERADVECVCTTHGHDRADDCAQCVACNAVATADGYVLADLAGIWSDHPDYRDEWRP